MKLKPVLLSIIMFVTCYGYSMDKRGIFLHSEYQFFGYNYFQFGIGFNPKRHLIEISRKKEQYSFIGYTLNYSKAIGNSDWGLAFQTVAYSGTYDGPIGLGLEFNMKNIDQINHFGIKPMIGLSFPIWSLMYAYNFDLYEDKTTRVSQHELILGLRIRVLKWP